MGTDVPVEPCFAVAQDRTARVARRAGDSVIEPLAIASRNQEFGINAAKRLGICIFDDGAM